jgi:uncharacterized membrane protein
VSDTVAIAMVLLTLHILAAVVWVGGMFFALVALRPASLQLQPPARLELWSGVLGRFFGWVIAAIALLLVTGYGMVFGVFAGFSGIGRHVHIMQGIGIIMMLLFFHLYFAPWRRFRSALERQDHAVAAVQLNQIRWIVTVNLLLGLLTVAVGSSGRYWG